MLNPWMNPLPGAAPELADRLIALYCAAQLTSSSVIDSGASEAGEITTPARKLEDWIGEAIDEHDRIIRRAVLLLICEKADEATHLSRVRALAKELHHYVTRR